MALFRRLFRGRTDVYPVRWESKTSGKSGYAPACANEWRPGIHELAEDVKSHTPDATPAVKDGDREHPIAGAWRPMLCEVVRCFVDGDYALSRGVDGVDPVSSETEEHIRAYVADYGATLVELPEETWRTSVAQWYGSFWDVLVDLWTAEEGRSDLVLQGRVTESEVGTRFSIHMVYVP
ncbi:MAG: TOTE conflict system archaeo-eukaryotic primase domain-containing protein [Burkholderiaceae bacterium]